MELRAIQKRNRDETIRAREHGDPKQRPSYGYMFVRLSPTAKIDHVAIDDVAAEIIREVARRILADETGKVTGATEAARLQREGIPAPSDRRAQLYARPMKGHVWTAKTVKHILTSEAALGFLMHDGRPVIKDGRPVRIAEPLWDRPTRDALIKATAPKRDGSRAPKGVQLLSGVAFCGNCGARLYLNGRRADSNAYGCTARVRGIRRRATTYGYSAAERAGADECARYLDNKQDYLGYGAALAKSWLIATGIIEGACRHIVKDRMDITGARWSLEGAEAILKLRALIANDDFEDYWRFHLRREHERIHHAKYRDSQILAA